MNEWHPDTQTDGALTPPPRVPPTAVATSAPMPPQPPLSRQTARRASARDLMNRALDQLDTLADGIANVVGLR